ncbi:uncharacterized protein LOC106871358 [Octopus bimaculoides]|uniref:uncharacterized protein LOC106871358 n=1 Tax=Octopus bimaculoides TaxID=37653 RepID=UPI00071D11D4|nr:uncharacterized protein LOC106871358 [Octopus bimaculoides]|eukprot:XP_014773256.1 PREDICTED: uncharacterized protein LOC106871358 [Octopus bimaculoides]
MEVRCHHCNALMFIGEHTGGTMNNPSFGICCKSGMIKIENIPELPNELADLFLSNTPEAKYFKRNIRRFNSAMVMCSISQTLIGNDSYPQYRHQNPRDGSFKASTRTGNREIAADNRYVVPYNAWLLQKYEAHINLEWCASIKAVKYLYKYIFKGVDHATVSLHRQEDSVRHNVGNENQMDEISNYENCRYTGASEACWRLFELPIHQQRQPDIECLPIHLPDQQMTVFNPNHVQEALANNRSTKLTAYLKMNEGDPLAKDILYCDFPQHYT